jgi:hypothetical protein
LTKIRATLRAPGLELRFPPPKASSRRHIDLLDLGACIAEAGRILVKARIPLRGIREEDRFDLVLFPDPASSALPDRGELTVRAELALVDGEPCVERLEARVEPLPVRLVTGAESFGFPLPSGLTETPFKTIRLETKGSGRGRLVFETDEVDAKPGSIDIPLRLAEWLPTRSRPALSEPDARRGLLVTLLSLLSGGSFEVDAGSFGHLELTIEESGGASRSGLESAGEGGLPLPPMSLQLRLDKGRYSLGSMPLVDVRSPLDLKAKLAPSLIPLESDPGRASGHLDVTELEMDGVLCAAGAQARVEVQGRGRLLLTRTMDRTVVRCSDVVLRAPGLRLGIEGEPGRDLRLDLAASPISLTLGWMGAELAIAAQRLAAPMCTLASGSIRLEQAIRCEQLRISFRSPLHAGGLFASGAAAMDELEASGEFGRGITEIEPLRIRGLRPSLSLAYEREGSAAEMGLSVGGLLTGHTSLEGLIRLIGDDLFIACRSGGADEGVRVEGCEIDLLTPGLELQTSVETGPLQPESMELRRGSNGVSLNLRLGRSVVGVRDFSAGVAGADGTFQGEATGELSGLELDAARDEFRMVTTGSGLFLRLLGEGVLKMGDTLLRLDRERASTVRLRGEVATDAEGDLVFRIDGGDVQARLGRSEHVHGAGHSASE